MSKPTGSPSSLVARKTRGPASGKPPTPDAGSTTPLLTQRSLLNGGAAGRMRSSGCRPGKCRGVGFSTSTSRTIRPTGSTRSRISDTRFCRKPPSGGLHVNYDAGDRELRSSVGQIGPGLDVRGEGGYVILPSPGSGYWWDPLWNFETVVPVAAPDWLWPPQPSRPPLDRNAMKPVTGLCLYGKAAIDGAVRAIISAKNQSQEHTLNAEAFSIGTLAGAGVVPGDIALRALLFAAHQMPNHDPAWPWRAEEIDAKVKRAFSAGTRHPRGTRYAR